MNILNFYFPWNHQSGFLIAVGEGHNHTQFAMGNVQWTLKGGCLNNVEVFCGNLKQNRSYYNLFPLHFSTLFMFLPSSLHYERCSCHLLCGELMDHSVKCCFFTFSRTVSHAQFFFSHQMFAMVPTNAVVCNNRKLKEK